MQAPRHRERIGNIRGTKKDFQRVLSGERKMGKASANFLQIVSSILNFDQVDQYDAAH